MKISGNIPLTLAFIIVLVIFLMLCGASIMTTMINSDVNNTGYMSNITWLWIPTLVSLLVSILLAWGIFWKKEV